MTVPEAFRTFYKSYQKMIKLILLHDKKTNLKEISLVDTIVKSLMYNR